MHTLLAKDFRLAGDALRPALLILVGFVVGLALLSAVPESILPLAGSLSITDSLYGLPRFLLVASGPFALVATAMTLRGDRRHGATILAGSLPVSAARQGASALVVLLVVTAALPAVCLVAGAIRLLTIGDSAGRLVLSAEPTAALLASACGTAYALAAARPGRSPAMTIGVASLLVVAAACMGAGISWVQVQLDPGLRAMASRLNETPAHIQHLRSISVTAAVLSGALGCAVTGVLTVLGLIKGYPSVVLRVTCVVLAIGACAVSVRASVSVREASLLNQSVTYRQGWVLERSRDELAALVRSLPSTAFRADVDVKTMTVGAFAIQGAAFEYLERLPKAAFATDPVAAAVRTFERFDSADQSYDTIMNVVPRRDPRRLGLVLDAVARYPDSPDLQLMALEHLPGAGSRWPVPSMPADISPKSLHAAVDATLRTALETLIREGHPESERMKAVLDVLPVDAAATQK